MAQRGSGAGRGGGYAGGASRPVVEVGGDDDFEDIVDSPMANGPAGGMLDGEGDDVDACEREFAIEGTSSAADADFDRKVGALQEVVTSSVFEKTLNDFCAQNCHVFEDTEENKLVYTEIFTKYTELIEGFLENALKQQLPGFDMQAFLEELVQRGEEEIDSAVFDLLLSLADFESFKQTMLACKQPAANLVVAGTTARIHEDEDEDGEQRNDLQDLLVISPASPKGK
eukprot:TRINITY_DN8855_c0_g1_i1.p1 TRINITY_DN8855_c0_g1~~TRINITY_DN8855_c0_g1_i1.p1  ORF type:complete len:228 (+),score=68.49 TRINITY_DN8855_c0_g1_i1:60-743(+)